MEEEKTCLNCCHLDYENGENCLKLKESFLILLDILEKELCLYMYDDYFEKIAEKCPYYINFNNRDKI